MDTLTHTEVKPAPSRGWLGNAYHYLMQAFGLLSGVIIAAISILVVYNVLSRNLGFGSVSWIMEGSEYALGAATFLGAPWVLYEGAHVRIDILLNSLSHHAGRWLEILVNLLGALVSAIFLHFMTITGFEYYERGTQVFKAFTFPEWWTFTVPVVCFALLVVEFIRRLWRLIDGVA
ncbi:TRAP transporter small permease [Marinobacter sp.]|uniref:TRAP transporter small permease n=1 Tax=Marinobacter sp. TaxID=50741 RepID=UPI00384C7756